MVPKTNKAEAVPGQLPSEYFTINSFKTLAGSAGAVWLCCLVIASLIPEHSLTYHQWRYIAFGLSEIITITMFLRTKKRKLENWLLTVLNGLLVFINASGLNAVSTGMAFVNKDAEKTISQSKSSFWPFTKELAWWPDAQLIKEINKQNQINIKLNNQNDSLRKALLILSAGVDPIFNTSSNGPTPNQADVNNNIPPVQFDRHPVKADTPRKETSDDSNKVQNGGNNKQAKSPKIRFIQTPDRMFLIVSIDDKYGVLNMKRDTIIRFGYQSITQFNYKRKYFFIVQSGSKFGALSTQGGVQIPLDFSSGEIVESKIRMAIDKSDRPAEHADF